MLWSWRKKSRCIATIGTYCQMKRCIRQWPLPKINIINMLWVRTVHSQPCPIFKHRTLWEQTYIPQHPFNNKNSYTRRHICLSGFKSATHKSWEHRGQLCWMDKRCNIQLAQKICPHPIMLARSLNACNGSQGNPLQIWQCIWTAGCWTSNSTGYIPRILNLLNRFHFIELATGPLKARCLSHDRVDLRVWCNNKKQQEATYNY